MAKPDLLTILAVVFTLGVLITAVAPSMTTEAERAQLQPIISDTAFATRR
ncbi:hypothetical protein [Sinobacterium norvegicum]|nr:hypothetical protein [Sinobacterium norvegicum]